MNLVIDIGNSRVKAGIFVNNKLVKNYTYSKFNITNLKTIFRENTEIKSTILCSVKGYPSSFKNFLSSHSCFIELTPKTSIPIKVSYKTPQTLGTDRLAGVCGAKSIYKDGAILVINAGTCITYDFIDSKDVFEGGAISPGLLLRYKALHTFTAKLPLTDPDMNYKKLTGTNTEESIRTGVQLGMIKEVEGIIKEYKTKFPGIKIILTGGDMFWLLKSLKIKIKGEPFLVLTGLNVILSFFLNQGNIASANRF